MGRVSIMPDFIDKILAYGFFKFDMDMSGKPGVHNGFEITKSQEKRMGHLLKKENRRRIKAMAKYQKEQERKFPKETIGPTYENSVVAAMIGLNIAIVGSSTGAIRRNEEHEQYR